MWKQRNESITILYCVGVHWNCQYSLIFPQFYCILAAHYYFSTSFSAVRNRSKCYTIRVIQIRNYQTNKEEILHHLKDYYRGSLKLLTSAIGFSFASGECIMLVKGPSLFRSSDMLPLLRLYHVLLMNTSSTITRAKVFSLRRNTL